MWHTSEGDRVLGGAEAELFRAGLWALVEQIKDEDELGACYCIQLFDELTWSQKLAVLEQLATHLLANETQGPDAAPKLTAVNEAAVGAVFEHISFEIDLEIEENLSVTTWRQRVLAACHESFGMVEVDAAAADGVADDELSIPENPESTRRDLWHPTVQLLADRILWDRDYEMVGQFLDEPPEKAALLRQIMGIDDAYFAVAADDLSSEKDVSNSLQRLTLMLAPFQL